MKPRSFREGIETYITAIIGILSLFGVFFVEKQHKYYWNLMNRNEPEVDSCSNLCRFI